MRGDARGSTGSSGSGEVEFRELLRGGWSREALEGRYASYRRRQATRLLTLLPRAAIRPLYRRARREAEDRGALDPKDPMEALVALVLEFLPLPPFDVWLADFREHLPAHLEDEAPTPYAPRRPDPVTAARRELGFSGAPWVAALKIYRTEAGWRGFIAFEPEDGVRHDVAAVGGARTAEIFREATPDDVADRFASFDEPTLQAFLRSALP